MNVERLIDDIYGAAACPDLWPEVMYDLAQLVDGAGGFVAVGNVNAWLGWRYSAGMEAAGAFVASEAVTRTQATARLLAADRAGFVADHEAFSEEEYRADAMVAECLRPAGLHHSTATAIKAPTGDLVVVQLARRVGLPQFSAEDVRRLDALRPHLARAGMLAARWRLERLRAVADALAMIGLPAAILDSQGKVLATNALLQALKSHLAWLPKDRIALVDPLANALLTRAIAEISNSTATSVRSFPSKPAAESPVVVHLIPATGRSRDIFEGGFGVLAFTPVAAPSTPDIALVRGLFDLTAAEARVASGVAEGLTPDQIARRDGTSRETVRYQLKTVFAKTGVSRQSQLASLLAAHARIPHKFPGSHQES
ncbi:MAG: helix-turn-helix transcriptional regulator [Methylocystis sp.]